MNHNTYKFASCIKMYLFGWLPVGIENILIIQFYAVYRTIHISETTAYKYAYIST
jgi:hypothetical protein